MYPVKFENTRTSESDLIILLSFTEQLKVRTETVDEITKKLKMRCFMWVSQDIFFPGRFRLMSGDTL